ncbi:MAG: N-acetyltransferase family protein [Acutalibacter sp.]
MGRTAVRRVNEWDGPSMLKVYSPYTGTHMAPEQEPPGLQEYVQRIDRYTYGLGWLLCEVDHQTVGFCHLSEDPSQPEDLFSVEFQLYVKQGLSRRRIGTALWQLMREMMEMGNRRRVLCRVDRDNQAALDFFTAMGFVSLAGDPPEEPEKAWLVYQLAPWDPQASKPTKPYLVEAEDYEAARERAAGLVDLTGI